jgi:hypothetical protein
MHFPIRARTSDSQRGDKDAVAGASALVLEHRKWRGTGAKEARYTEGTAGKCERRVSAEQVVKGRMVVWKGQLRFSKTGVLQARTLRELRSRGSGGALLRDAEAEGRAYPGYVRTTMGKRVEAPLVDTVSPHFNVNYASSILRALSLFLNFSTTCASPVRDSGSLSWSFSTSIWLLLLHLCVIK